MSETTGGPRIRVGLPMLTMVPGGMGGTETYVSELVRGLAGRPDLTAQAWVSRAAAGSFDGIPVPVSVVDHVGGGPSVLQRLGAIARAGTSRRLAREVAMQSDVVHHPFTVPVPRTGDRPHVVTLSDVQHLDLPGFFPASERVYRRVAYDRAAKRADVVITLSEFCRGRIAHHLGIPLERIVVAHLAVASDFTVSRAERRPFVLYPARRWPHKNHDRLLAAMDLLRAERPDLRLVLTGGGDPLPQAPDWVEQRGLVSRAELVELYRTAGCLAFPSLYEGFGLPPLEAMATGCPVAVSDAGSLPEICGDAGITFDPTDVPAMAAAIGTALDAGDRLSELARARAAQFTWQRCVEVHAATYRRLAAA